jgi:hypothetical protein
VGRVAGPADLHASGGSNRVKNEDSIFNDNFRLAYFLVIFVIERIYCKKLQNFTS